LKQLDNSTKAQFPDIPTSSPSASQLSKNETPQMTLSTTSANTSPSISLLTAENSRGTLIILNGCQAQDTHTKLIEHLRTGLIEKGWNTLLLEIPDNNAESYKAAIKEGSEYIKSQMGTPFTLLGHGCDAQALLNQATMPNSPNISAYIALSLKEAATHKTTYKFNAPLLDVHGSIGTTTESNPTWLKSVEKSGGRRMELPMANADFLDQEDHLIFLISNWLKNQ